MSELTKRASIDPPTVERPLTTWGLLVSVSTLILNDHFLKTEFPGVLTGKASDFAGLFAAPLFLSAIVPRFSRLIYVITGTGFVLWKSSLTRPLIAIWNDVGPFDIGRLEDPTDLVALVMLPLSYYYGREATAITHDRLLASLVGTISVIAFGATSYRTGFADYTSTYWSTGSRNEVLSALSSLEDDENYFVHPARGSAQIEAARTQWGLDSSFWIVYLSIPFQDCFRAHGQISLFEEPSGVHIRLLQLGHHCPESDGDRQSLLDHFEREIVERLGWQRTSIPTTTRAEEHVACFNNGGDDDSHGVWIYEGHSDWRRARRNVKGMLVFGFEPGRAEYSLRELEYCWYSIESEIRQTAQCRSGTLKIDAFDPPTTVGGRYSFVLTNGTRRESDFSAVHCPQ